MADVHMRDSARSEIERELSWIVERFNSEFEPDHVFVLGDLIQHGESAAVDRRRVGRVRSLLDRTTAPVTYLLGNHDVENLSRDTLSDLLDQNEFHGFVDVEETPVAYLDSTRTDVSGARGELGPERLEAIRSSFDERADAMEATDAVEAIQSDGVLVLTHHPVGLVDLTDNVWFEGFPERALLGDRKELLVTLLEQPLDVRATLAGHVHDTQRVEFWGLPHLTMGPLSKERPGVPVTGTYAELVVDEGIEVAVRVRDETVVSFGVD